MADETEGYTVPALARGLGILALFTRERPEWSLSDIARAMGLPRSSAFRLTYTLEAAGFLQRAGEKRFRLGGRVLDLGYNYVASQDIVEIARPQLERLRDAFGASAHLGILQHREVLYLARVPSREMVISNIGVGSRLPAHATTMGRMLLTGLPAGELRRLYDGADLRTAATGAAPTLDAFMAMIEEDRERGHVAGASSYEKGLASVAAPVRNRSGAVVAAINVSGPEAALELGRRRGEVVAAVVEAARRISAEIGDGTDGAAVQHDANGAAGRAEHRRDGVPSPGEGG